MTIEPTESRPEQGPPPDNGQVQPQGHRRRRRRRKNKPGVAGQPNQPGPTQQAAQGPPQTQAPQQQPRPQHTRQHQHQGRKKKFFSKSQAPQAQPGNSVKGGQAKRKGGRQKGPRAFVGPMDHSYRTVNGNTSDGPPSTIPFPSNGHGGGYYPDAYSGQSAAPVREDAPTRILCFIEDLFFLAKIQESARKLGVKVEFAKGDKEVVDRICDTPEGARPALLVFDLNNANAKPMTLIPKFKSKLKKTVSIIGFLNHLQGDLKIKAMEAGCDVVMPRSAFSQNLPTLLRRYGAEEEEQYERQPAI